MSAVDVYADRFGALFGPLTGAAAAGPDAVRALRARAFAQFAETGFPTTQHEEWRFTNVAPIAEAPFTVGGGAAAPARAVLEPFLFDGAIATQIVVVNGRLSTALSSLDQVPAGVTIEVSPDAATTAPSASPAALARAPFAALNTAFCLDVIAIRVAPGAVIDAPIHVLFVTTPGTDRVMAPARLVVTAGERSQLTLVESYAGLPGAGRGFTNAVTDVLLADAAVVDHYKLQREAADGYHVAAMFVDCARRATFSSQSIVAGGAIVRNDVFARLGGEGAECTLNGLYLAGGDALVDNHTSIDHAMPHCPSHEVYKGILSGRAKAVFNGKITVRPDAQKTDAKQTNKALLLSDDASINTKPQLEIFADDVKCTHGAAIGQLDDDALFYCRARGIAEVDARNLLIHAFAGEIIDHIKSDAVRGRVQGVVDAMLETF